MQPCAAMSSVEPSAEPKWVMSVTTDLADRCLLDLVLASEDTLEPEETAADVRALMDEDTAEALIALRDPRVEWAVARRRQRCLQSAWEAWQRGGSVVQSLATSCAVNALPVGAQAGTSAECQLLMLGSGSCLHACPKEFAPSVPMQPVSAPMKATAVNGANIPVLGAKRAQLRTWGGILLQVLFCVMAVSRPLLSVGLSRQRGYDVHLSGMSYLARGDRRVPLVESEALCYLPVVCDRDRSMTGVPVDSMRPASQLMAPVVAQIAPRWHLMEWCCEEDSRLSAWFSRHAQAATRLRLPQYDLRTYSSARRVLAQIREQTRQGRNVLLWAASPCSGGTAHLC